MERRWSDLTAEFAPVSKEDHPWCYSRAPHGDDPTQGWKIHIAATILTAGETLRRVGPLLVEDRVLFKVPRTLSILTALNAGLVTSTSQVGKFLTVYPRSEEEAVLLAEKLHGATVGLEAPWITSERRYRPDSNVFYRYGAFAPAENAPDGLVDEAPPIRTPDGALVEDRRELSAAVPDWLANPFPQTFENRKSSPFERYRGFHALSQRGKGGVYGAVDVESRPPRMCVLKEGRRNGESDWHGNDGALRVRHEARVLSALGSVGIPVPQIYDQFECEENFYLVIEDVDGVHLNELGDLAPTEKLVLAARIAWQMERVHAEGWVWRDCKPANILVCDQCSPRLIDFEGACRIDKTNLEPWGSPVYLAPEATSSESRASCLPQDLYALGVTILELLKGALPINESGEPAISASINDLPQPFEPAVSLLQRLTAEDPSARPSAKRAASVLARATG
jgi:hypothetical protein